MRMHFSIRRFRPQFTLRTLFIAVTAVALWIGYHVNWIHQRREARKWIAEHIVPGQLCAFGSLPSLQDFPWTLQLLGEQPRESDIVAPSDAEKRNLKVYRQRAVQVAVLFPECIITDISKFLEEKEIEDRASGYQ